LATNRPVKQDALQVKVNYPKMKMKIYEGKESIVNVKYVEKYKRLYFFFFMQCQGYRKALCMLGKCSTTELPQPCIPLLISFKNNYLSKTNNNTMEVITYAE
jgi:hypothetical protein